MTNLRKLYSFRQTPQNQPIANTKQVANSAGGFAWAVDDWARLDRFLVLGSEAGTYYVRPQQLTRENAEAVIRCIQANGRYTVDRIIKISESGRAPKNDPALFALALCASVGDLETRQAALAALPRVARIGTHLFHFLEFVEGFRGWGRGLRRAVGHWYTEMPAERLAYQAVKYRRRDGWSHRDALRLAHPKATTHCHNQLFNWITQGWEDLPAAPFADKALDMIWAFEQAQRVTSEQEIITLIQRYNLPREAIPTEWLTEAVWRALLPKLSMTALIRNLATMTAKGVLKPNNKQTRLVAARITDKKQLHRARIHPIAVLAALQTYAQGKGTRGKLTWQPITHLIDALDKAFYLSFRNVKPSGKRLLLALDVSGSMGWGAVAGVSSLTPRAASAAMALVTAATETQTEFVAFSHEMVQVNISARQRLDDVISHTSKIPFGATDCALPMLWALENKVKVDAFIIYTDSETWYGRSMHPAQALQTYRRKMGIPAKLVVVGMVSNGFSIADPNDGGMLDVVGFDTATPQLMADFVAS